MILVNYVGMIAKIDHCYHTAGMYSYCTNGTARKHGLMLYFYNSDVNGGAALREKPAMN